MLKGKRLCSVCLNERPGNQIMFVGKDGLGLCVYCEDRLEISRKLEKGERLEFCAFCGGFKKPKALWMGFNRLPDSPVSYICDGCVRCLHKEQEEEIMKEKPKTEANAGVTVGSYYDKHTSNFVRFIIEDNNHGIRGQILVSKRKPIPDAVEVRLGKSE